MRFAHYLPAYPQPGGVGVAVRGLVEASEQEGRGDEILSYGQIDVHDKSASTTLSARLLLSSPFPIPLLDDPVQDRLAQLDALDGLILHGVFTPSCSRLAAETRRRAGLATVAYPHDAYDKGLFGTHSARKRAYWSTVERPYLQRCDLIVVSAPTHAELLRNAGIRTRTLLAPPGLTPDDAARARHARTVRARRPIGEPLRLLALGRWDVYEKGLDLLCEAASDSSLRDLVHLRLVGPEYGARPQIDALLGRYGLENVEAIGYVDDVWPELIAADALVLPSRKEGFGLVALQALASGLPVLLSDAAGIAEQVADRGVVLVQPDVTSVRQGLHDLVERSAALTELAQQSSSDLTEQFTWSRTLGRIAAAIEQL
jgi:glycosyltransferase involved in cell wall biosynthesis